MGWEEFHEMNIHLFKMVKSCFDCYFRTSRAVEGEPFISRTSLMRLVTAVMVGLTTMMVLRTMLTYYLL